MNGLGITLNILFSHVSWTVLHRCNEFIGRGSSVMLPCHIVSVAAEA